MAYRPSDAAESDLNSPMLTPVPVASTSTPSVVLTCTQCATQRPGPPYETHHIIGGQTQAHCGSCHDVNPHFVGSPEARPVAAKRRSDGSTRTSPHKKATR